MAPIWKFLFALFRFLAHLIKFWFFNFSPMILDDSVWSKKLAGSGKKITRLPQEERFLEPIQKNVISLYIVVLTPPFKYLRSKGHLSVKYIDALLFLGETFEICFKIIRATVAVLRELEFIIHPETSVLVPSYTIYTQVSVS